MKLKVIFLSVLLHAIATQIWAQTETESYVPLDEQPNAVIYLPQPPDTASVDFTDDMLMWQWGKTQRLTPRGEQASRESLWLPAIMRTVMAEVLELDTISDETTPAMSRLLVRIYHAGDESTKKAKNRYTRRRPFARMNEDTWGQWDDETLRTNGSYPSGHTAFGWATALVFSEMWPELQDTLLRRGIQFGENRIITGAHWQSDVTAGYLCGAATVARSHTNPDLQNDILAARAEYAGLKGLPADYDPAASADMPHGERFLNNPVDTTNHRYLSDVLRHWDAKGLRQTPRGEQAKDEAKYSVAMMQQVFGEAMGLPLSDKGTPAITALLNEVLTRASEVADRLKPLRFRKRPYVQLGEVTAVPDDEEKERDKSSFPSGHTNLGWATALALVEVAPECQDEILRRGYQYGYNRLIVGYHWASDIEATRQLASALIARLHAEPAFRKLIADAREEYMRQTTGINATGNSQSKADAWYDMPGHQFSSKPMHSGVYVNNGRKVVVK